MAERTSLTLYRNSDIRITYSLPDGYNLTGYAPVFYFRTAEGESPVLTVSGSATANGSLALIEGGGVVLTVKAEDAALFPGGDISTGVYDSTLTKDNFVNRFVGGPVTVYVDGSYGKGLFQDAVIIDLGGQDISVIIEGGNLAVGASVALSELNAAVAEAGDSAEAAEISAAQAASAVAGVPAMIAGKADITGGNIVDAGAFRSAISSVGTAALAASGGSALVGFLQSGTGAVARTGQGKFRDLISVKDFGAVGDGVEDDTAAIQAAITYAHSLSLGNITVPYDTIRKGGSVVFLPAGAYKTTATIEIKEGVVLQGAGRFSTVITSSYDGQIIRNQTPQFYDAFGMGIKDLCVQGDRTKTAQVGISLLRDWMGAYSNVAVVECGSHGWRLYQCISTALRDIEALECVGNGIYVTDGINTWADTSLSNLPSNNLTFYDPHVYGCDGAGIRFEGLGSGIGVMGCQVFGGSSEYNYKSEDAGEGYNIELIDTSSPVPNVFYSHWCEDDKVLAHVLVNLSGATELAKFVNFKHFGSGAAAWPQKAVVCQTGTVDLVAPCGSSTVYRTYLGSGAPFQLTKATGIIKLSDPTGCGLTRDSAWVVDETGASTGLTNNLFQNANGVLRGAVPKAILNQNEAGPEWRREDQSFPFMRMEPFFFGMAFGGGLGNPDVALARVASRTLGATANDFSGDPVYFQLGGAWNGTHALLGTYHLWVDGTGVLRIKNGLPSSDTDGTVVGTQT